MPLPQPQPGEDHDRFISRCMEDDEAIDEFPDEDHRLAVCEERWSDSRNAIAGLEERVRKLNAEIRVEGEGKSAKLTGLAAPFDQWSSDLGFEGSSFFEIIRRGAFKETIERNDDVRALVGHDPEKIIGRRSKNTLRIWTTAAGLRFRVRPPDTTIGNDLIENVGRGDIDGVSIGFRVPKGGDRSWFEDDFTVFRRELLKIDLIEFSFVAFPAYEGTSASSERHLWGRARDAGMAVALRSLNAARDYHHGIMDRERRKRLIADLMRV